MVPGSVSIPPIDGRRLEVRPGHLLVLDAEDLELGPVGSAVVDARFPDAEPTGQGARADDAGRGHGTGDGQPLLGAALLRLLLGCSRWE
jgi:hypothetical protein